MEEFKNLLYRIDERVDALSKKNLVTRTELDLELKPLKAFVYGFVGTILVAVLGAIVALIIKK
jgi:hypothetical protein